MQKTFIVQDGAKGVKKNSEVISVAGILYQDLPDGNEPFDSLHTVG